MARPIRLSTAASWLATAAAVIAYAFLALTAASLLTACGGGDDGDDHHLCVVEGKPMPPEACK